MWISFITTLICTACEEVRLRHIIILYRNVSWLLLYVSFYNCMFPGFRVYGFFSYADVSWLWYSVMFCILIFHDFVTMWCFASWYSMTLLLCVCFTSRYSMTLVQCVVLYTDIPWLYYYVLFYIRIFRDFVTMCCFILRI